MSSQMGILGRNARTDHKIAVLAMYALELQPVKNTLGKDKAIESVDVTNNKHNFLNVLDETTKFAIKRKKCLPLFTRPR